MKTSRPIANRSLAPAFAAALVLAACGEPGTPKVADTASKPPIPEANPEEIPHMLRPVIVEGSDGVTGMAADGERTADVAPTRPPEDGRDAADQYIERATPVEPAAPAVAVAEAAPERPVTRPVQPPRPAAVPPRAVVQRAPAPVREPEAEPARVPQAAPAPRPVPAAPRVVAPMPDSADARSLNQRGIALINAGRPAQAIPSLERAVAMQPADAEMLGNLGYAYMLTGQHQKARTRLLRALELSPTRSATWLNLGQTYAELGQSDSAVDAVLKGYQYSTRKTSVRSALHRAATGERHSPAWRDAAGTALARISG